MLKTARVSSKGQVAIPKDIRKVAGIEQGEELVFLYHNGKILLERAEDLIDWDNDIEGWQKLGLTSLTEVWDNEEDEIWNTYPEGPRSRKLSLQRSEKKQTSSSNRRLKRQIQHKK